MPRTPPIYLPPNDRDSRPTEPPLPSGIHLLFCTVTACLLRRAGLFCREMFMAVKTEEWLTKKPEPAAISHAPSPEIPVALHGRELTPNHRIPLDVSWVEEVRVNTSAVERRAATIGTRRSGQEGLAGRLAAPRHLLHGPHHALRRRLRRARQAPLRQGPPPARRPSPSKPSRSKTSTCTSAPSASTTPSSRPP